MASCELCGRPNANLLAKVAGTESVVCDSCASLGEVIKQVREAPKQSEIKKIEQQKQQFVKRTWEVVGEIGELVRGKREELGLKQEELAKKINESESLVRRIEHGFIPSINTAKKLESLLKLNLIESVGTDEQEYTQNKGGGATTLGDIMIIKKSK